MEITISGGGVGRRATGFIHSDLTERRSLAATAAGRVLQLKGSFLGPFHPVSVPEGDSVAATCGCMCRALLTPRGSLSRPSPRAAQPLGRVQGRVSGDSGRAGLPPARRGPGQSEELACPVPPGGGPTPSFRSRPRQGLAVRC